MVSFSRYRRLSFSPMALESRCSRWSSVANVGVMGWSGHVGLEQYDLLEGKVDLLLNTTGASYILRLSSRPIIYCFRDRKN